jgi:hypothetical protein
MEAFTADPELDNLLISPSFAKTVNATQGSARVVNQVARAHGIPCPAMSASLDYVDTYRQERLPANLIQGQRDFFGAHTYKRLDKQGTFHTIWTPEGTPEHVASDPSQRETWEGGQGEGDKAPRGGELPPGTDQDAAVVPENRELQPEAEESGSKATR